MARRPPKTSATGGNLDSMLDTLTNVVGILVIVLVTVQLTSEEAARRIVEALENISPEEVAQIEQQAAAAQQAADDAERQLQERQQAAKRDPSQQLALMATEAESLNQVAESILAKAAEMNEQKKREQESLQQALAEATAKKEELDRELQAVTTRRAALSVELDQTKMPAPLPAKEVRLPDPRPAPAGAKELVLFCRENRIWIADFEALRAQAHKRAAFVVRRKNLDPDNDDWLSDGQVFVAEFNKTPLAAGDFDLTIEVVGASVYLVLNRKPRSGQTADAAAKSTGDLARLSRRYKPSDYYLRFLVWPDGFEGYLTARNFTNERGFAAGWLPMDDPKEYRIGLGKYSIGIKPPPPPPPPPNPNPPPPSKPTKPPNLID
jgi:hypothetical protein